MIYKRIICISTLRSLTQNEKKSAILYVSWCCSLYFNLAVFCCEAAECVHDFFGTIRIMETFLGATSFRKIIGGGGCNLQNCRQELEFLLTINY